MTQPKIVLTFRPHRGRLAVAAVVVGVLTAGLVQPAAANALSNVGGGAVSGTAHFSQPIPQAGQACAPTTFTLSGGSSMFTLTTVNLNVISGYAGPLTFSGSGGSGCESGSSGSGNLTLTATGDGSVYCPSLGGSYARVATDVQVSAGGGCTINGVPAQILFNFHGEFVPTNTGGGLTAPITDASFAGAVVVLPA
ncbi:MAG: hypothetical protein QOI91_432 [Solirubrobacteraceae bacterium]|jgi:hypothetical protein|nr:hypothetical protein [Solirubrobacteraceae bacterium]